MHDAALLKVLELLLNDRFKTLQAAAQTDGDKQYADEFGWALCYLQERIKDADRLSGALAPFTG